MTSRTHRGIAAEIHGEGEPVLLLHGIGGCADAFAGVAGLLAEGGYRTIAWDAPGYGASTDPADPPGADGYVGAVVALLEDLGAVPAHVVGVSWGGVIATCLAAHRPDCVRSLTLVDSTRGSGITPERARAMLDRVDELRDVGATEFAHRRAGRLPAAGADPEVVAEIARQMGRIRMAGYRGAAEMMAATNTESLLPGITAPTLVLVGEHDQVTGVAESELLARTIPGARLIVIPDAGHAAAQERPGAVTEAITAFLHDVREHDVRESKVAR